MQIQLNKLFIGVLLFFLYACGANSTREKELELDERERVIRERELELNQRETALLGAQNTIIIKEELFEVPLGETVNEFSYTKTGELMYKGARFIPDIRTKPEYVTEFKISLLESKQMAGAIAQDVDGQNLAFLLNLADMTSIPLQAPDSWNAAKEIYWSPSTKFMLAYCSYEGANFLGLNTETKEIKYMSNLKPHDDYSTRWNVYDKPKWLNNKDVLEFTVAEYCNPFEVDCGDSANKPLAKYKVNLDAETMKIYKVK